MAVHLRAPELDGAHLFEAASWLMDRCRGPGCSLFVNDRLDVALAVGALGVHLKANSMDPQAARAVGGPDLVLGQSIHRAAEAGSAGAAPLDYLVMGSVFPTLTHPGQSALPTTAPSMAATASSIPVLAVGGITPGRVADLIEAGMYGVVVFRGIWEADRPREAVSAYLEILS